MTHPGLVLPRVCSPKVTHPHCQPTDHDQRPHITDLLWIKAGLQNPTIILLGSSAGTTFALFTWRMVLSGGQSEKERLRPSDQEQDAFTASNVRLGATLV